MRILLFSERIAPPFDEGIKAVAIQMGRHLRARHEVCFLTTFGQDVPEERVTNLPSNPLLWSPWVAAAVARFRPELILYIPTACATPASFWRSRMLRLYGRGAPVALIALQIRRYGGVAREVMSVLRPELVLVQSEATRASLAPMGCRLLALPPAVDIERFRPRSAEERRALRRQYALDPAAYVALHVGHLNRGRNVQALAALQGLDGVQVVVVGSSSSPQEDALVRELKGTGVRVIREYVAHIEDLYALADCYLFPVRGENSAIDLPLSVLEAMACDLPVVTTRYGGLAAYLSPTDGLRFVEDPSEMADALAAVRRVEHPGTRRQVSGDAWPRVVARTLDAICRELGLALIGDEAAAKERASS